MKQNVKIVSRLVRKAKTELDQGRHDEALELMRKALTIDDSSSLVIQVIQAIGRKQARDKMKLENESPEEETVEEVQSTPPEETVEEEPAVDDVREEAGEERKPSMASEDQITLLFEASDTAFDQGDQSKAVAYLKRARKLDPTNPSIDEKVSELKLKVKSLKMVTIARKKLQSGDVEGCIVSARQAFDIMPQARGLADLLTDLESLEEEEVPDVPAEDPPAEEEPAVEEPDRSYITEIRRLVQDNALEKAADLARTSYQNNSNDDLLAEFVDKFRKLGLID